MDERRVMHLHRGAKSLAILDAQGTPLFFESIDVPADVLL